MRKTVLGFAAVAAALVVAAPSVEAQSVQVGPTLAFHDDFDFGIGATVGAQLPSLGQGIGFMGDFLIFFPDEDGIDYFEFNGNLTYDFPLANSTAVPFVLAGLNLGRVSVDVLGLDTSNTELGLNLGGGIVFDLASFRPAVGGRFEIEGGEGFVIFATLPFSVGG